MLWERARWAGCRSAAAWPGKWTAGMCVATDSASLPCGSRAAHFSSWAAPSEGLGSRDRREKRPIPAGCAARQGACLRSHGAAAAVLWTEAWQAPSATRRALGRGACLGREPGWPVPAREGVLLPPACPALRGQPPGMISAGGAWVPGQQAKHLTELGQTRRALCEASSCVARPDGQPSGRTGDGRNWSQRSGSCGRAQGPAGRGPRGGQPRQR